MHENPPTSPSKEHEPFLGSISVESLHEPWFVSFKRQIGELFEKPANLPPLPQYRPAQEGEDTLGPMTIESVQEPWFHSLFRQIREAGDEKKLPKLQLTSKPVAVRSIWGLYDYKQRGVSTSALVHVVTIVLMFTVFSGAPGPQALGESVTLIIPVDITPYLANLQLKGPDDSTGGGGGGGQNSPLPANRGKRPRFDPTQLTPPTPIIRNEQPKLAAEPTLLGPVDLEAPQVNMSIFGDPMGKIGPPSAGPGSGGGIGTGKGTGIGSGKGGGFGPGEGGGAGGGVFRVGNGVTPPRPLFKPEPEYSEEARKAKYQGTVVLYVEIWPDGKAHNIRVVRSLGLGLDDKAIEAVLKWKFAPGKKDNTPVKVGATIEVNFRLL
jgi:TonB family protein